jgi:hypothetical protein
MQFIDLLPEINRIHEETKSMIKRIRSFPLLGEH